MELILKKSLMKNKYFKWGGILLAIIIAFFVYRYFNDQRVFARLDMGGVGDFPVSKRQYEAWTKDIDSRYKNDNYGSTTPEGTLELFIEALKKEDVTLAAKYFVAEKQKNMEDDLRVGLKSGGIKEFINLSDSLIQKKCYDYDKTCEISSVGMPTKTGYLLTFRLNKFTQKWKIESL